MLFIHTRYKTAGECNENISKKNKSICIRCAKAEPYQNSNNKEPVGLILNVASRANIVL